MPSVIDALELPSAILMAAQFWVLLHCGALRPQASIRLFVP
jgi:hypothetical protein